MSKKWCKIFISRLMRVGKYNKIILMNEKISEALSEELHGSNGLHFLVPESWWEQFCFFNSKTIKIENLFFPDLSIEHYVDNFLYDFQGSIIDELEMKTSYLKFQRVLISPQIKPNVSWKSISSALWKRITRAKGKIRPVVTIIEEGQKQDAFKKDLTQVQIVFCSKTKSDLFVGFVPGQVSVAKAVRQIGYEMGFVEMQSSKIVQPDFKRQLNYSFHEFEALKVKDSKDNFYMAYNLQNIQQKKDEKDFSFNPITDNTQQAIIGDLGMVANDSWSHVQNNERTLSTGAETPFFSFSREEYGPLTEFRVRELFREKKPEQIQKMKEDAMKNINGEQISIPVEKQQPEMLEKHLEQLSEQIISHIHEKKKNIKQKQLQLE